MKKPKKIKVKTRKSIIKRFRITKTGKVLRKRSFTGHLNVKKSRNKTRAAKRNVTITNFYAKKIKKTLGVRKSKNK